MSVSWGAVAIDPPPRVDHSPFLGHRRGGLPARDDLDVRPVAPESVSTITAVWAVLVEAVLAVAEDAPASAPVELPRSCDGAVLRGFDAGR